MVDLSREPQVVFEGTDTGRVLIRQIRTKGLSLFRIPEPSLLIGVVPDLSRRVEVVSVDVVGDALNTGC